MDDVEKNKDVKTSIEGLTKLRVKNLMQRDFSEGHFDKERADIQLKQAKLGMTYIRDQQTNKRIEQGQFLRVVGMITKDEKERAEYIKASMPKLLNK